MTYEYDCDGCQKRHEVVKPATESARSESCPDCRQDMRKHYSRTHLTGTKVQEKYFNHGLGFVGTDNDFKKHARANGMIEVGNERVEKHVKVEVDDYSSI